MTSPAPNTPINADAFWMPFTANRRYKRDPVLFSAAEGMHYIRPVSYTHLDVYKRQSPTFSSSSSNSALERPMRVTLCVTRTVAG